MAEPADTHWQVATSDAMLVAFRAGAVSTLDHEGATMSDIEKKPEQLVDAEKANEKIEDLPIKGIRDEDAAAIKGGEVSLSYSTVKYTYTQQK